MLFEYIIQIIMFFVGVWATGIGYGSHPVLEKDAVFHEVGKTFFKIIGPLFIVIALAFAGAELMGIVPRGGST